VLAGFVNSLFLLFIAFFIMSEAVERAIEPPEVNFETFSNFYHFDKCFLIVR
jgi:Co/Zn/Cd efflux system component